MQKEIQKILKFIVVGISNVAIDFGLYLILFRLLHVNPYLAASVSFVVAATNSYWHNRRWTFSDGQRHVVTQYVQFMSINAVGLVFNNGLTYVFLQYIWLGSYNLTAYGGKLAATVLIVIWNYTVSRYVIFRPHVQGTK